MVDVYKYIKPPVSTLARFDPEEFPIKQGIAQFHWNGAVITISVADGSIATSVNTKEEGWNMCRKIKPSEDTWKLILTETLETAQGLLVKSAMNHLAGLKNAGVPYVIQ